MKHPPTPKLELGKFYTGRREIAYDSRTGEYRESLPSLDENGLLWQRTLLRHAKQQKAKQQEPTRAATT